MSAANFGIPTSANYLSEQNPRGPRHLPSSTYDRPHLRDTVRSLREHQHHRNSQQHRDPLGQQDQNVDAIQDQPIDFYQAERAFLTRMRTAQAGILAQHRLQQRRAKEAKKRQKAARSSDVSVQRAERGLAREEGRLTIKERFWDWFAGWCSCWRMRGKSAAVATHEPMMCVVDGRWVTDEPGAAYPSVAEAPPSLPSSAAT